MATLSNSKSELVQLCCEKFPDTKAWRFKSKSKSDLVGLLNPTEEAEQIESAEERQAGANLEECKTLQNSTELMLLPLQPANPGLIPSFLSQNLGVPTKIKNLSELIPGLARGLKLQWKTFLNPVSWNLVFSRSLSFAEILQVKGFADSGKDSSAVIEPGGQTLWGELPSQYKTGDVVKWSIQYSIDDKGKSGIFVETNGTLNIECFADEETVSRIQKGISLGDVYGGDHPFHPCLMSQEMCEERIAIAPTLDCCKEVSGEIGVGDVVWKALGIDAKSCLGIVLGFPSLDTAVVRWFGLPDFGQGDRATSFLPVSNLGKVRKIINVDIYYIPFPSSLNANSVVGRLLNAFAGNMTAKNKIDRDYLARKFVCQSLSFSSEEQVKEFWQCLDSGAPELGRCFVFEQSGLRRLYLECPFVFEDILKIDCLDASGEAKFSSNRTQPRHIALFPDYCLFPASFAGGEEPEWKMSLEKVRIRTWLFNAIANHLAAHGAEPIEALWIDLKTRQIYAGAPALVEAFAGDAYWDEGILPASQKRLQFYMLPFEEIRNCNGFLINDCWSDVYRRRFLFSLDQFVCHSHFQLKGICHPHFELEFDKKKKEFWQRHHRRTEFICIRIPEKTPLWANAEDYQDADNPDFKYRLFVDYFIDFGCPEAAIKGLEFLNDYGFKGLSPQNTVSARVLKLLGDERR